MAKILRKFEEMVGHTITKVTVDDDSVHFIIEDGEEYILQHIQDCCESVSIESIDGDIQRLVGSPVTLAYESYRSSKSELRYESCTWSFYTIGTVIDTVSIRFFGSSNGYYSETAEFYHSGKRY